MLREGVLSTEHLHERRERLRLLYQDAHEAGMVGLVQLYGVHAGGAALTRPHGPRLLTDRTALVIRECGVVRKLSDSVRACRNSCTHLFIYCKSSSDRARPSPTARDPPGGVGGCQLANVWNWAGSIREHGAFHHLCRRRPL